ncbi:MAG: acyl-CoA dehydrogenase family protein, partial [Vicinamibacteria bacterium]
MDFRLSEEQLALKESARKFAEKEIAPRSRRNDLENRFDWEAWRKAGEWGLLGLPIPQKYGGGGLSVLDSAIAMEGIGLGSRDVGFLTSVGAHIVICEIPIWEWATEAQKQKYLPKLCRGEWIGAFGLTEPNAGSDVASLEMRAERKRDRYLLTGTKTLITNAPIADVALVF